MKKIESGDFPGGPLVMTLSSQLQGSQVPSLIGDLGTHMPCIAWPKKKKKKLKAYRKRVTTAIKKKKESEGST